MILQQSFHSDSILNQNQQNQIQLRNIQNHLHCQVNLILLLRSDFDGLVDTQSLGFQNWSSLLPDQASLYAGQIEQNNNWYYSNSCYPTMAGPPPPPTHSGAAASSMYPADTPYYNNQGVYEATYSSYAPYPQPVYPSRKSILIFTTDFAQVLKISIQPPMVKVFKFNGQQSF